jgi:hypothetical protein
VRRPSYAVAFAGAPQRREPLVVDETTARILQLSDGTRTVAQIVDALVDSADRTAARECAEWIERLFVNDLLGLSDAAPAPG